MEYIDQLQSACDQLDRVTHYLNGQSYHNEYDLAASKLSRAERGSSLAGAKMFVLLASHAVQFEHRLLDRVRVYRLTGS